jgi:chromosome segregation ATPase
MADKDLGEELENIEENIENLKNKEFRIAGIKVTPVTAMAALSAIGALIGSLYGGFLMYQKVEQAIEFVEQQEEYEEKINSYDGRMKLTETKLEEALDYSRSIKNDLRDDFNRMEKSIDRIDGRVRDVQSDLRVQEDKVKEMIDRASERFDLKRDSLASDTNVAIDALENRLNKKIQQALDNPLAN